MVVERTALVHQDDRRIADQRRRPARGIGIGRADVRIERPHRQQIADRRERDVDQEHDPHEPRGQRHRIAGQPRHVEVHRRRPVARHDRDHERGEETLDRPGAGMAGQRMTVCAVGTARQPQAEMPCPVARLRQPAIEPEDIGDRAQQQQRNERRQHRHGEQIRPLPVPAPEAVDGRDDRPCRPEPNELRDAHVAQVRGGRGRALPVDPGGRPAMDAVDQQRPQQHRHPARHDRDHGRIGAIDARDMQDGEQIPSRQPDQAREAHAMAHRGGGYRIGGGARGHASILCVKDDASVSAVARRCESPRDLSLIPAHARDGQAPARA